MSRAAPQRAAAAIIIPFHDASTFSSRPGAIRFARKSNSVFRAAAFFASNSSREIANSAATSSQSRGRLRIVCPSQFPPADTSYDAANRSASSPRASRISASDQTKNLPSSPSLSASCVAA